MVVTVGGVGALAVGISRLRFVCAEASMVTATALAATATALIYEAVGNLQLVLCNTANSK